MLVLALSMCFVKSKKIANNGDGLNTNIFTTFLLKKCLFIYAYLQKSATVPNGVNGYSLEGAVYGLYASEANAASDSSRLKTLTTNASGKSNTVQVKVGTYYVKEITAPAGFALDTAIHSVTVTAANTSSSPAVISVTDVPLFGSAKVIKVSEDGAVEGLTFKIDGPVVRQKETDASRIPYAEEL